MSGQRSFLVFYDVSSPRRLRRMERVLAGYGYRVQESVFFCTLSALLRARMERDINDALNRDHDQCVILDLGADPDVLDRAACIGRKIVKPPSVTVI